jgi:hypothetical protein
MTTPTGDRGRQVRPRLFGSSAGGERPVFLGESPHVPDTVRGRVAAESAAGSAERV